MADPKPNYKRPRQGPPPGPWTKGQHPEYDLLVAEVLVIRDDVGRVYSKHQLQDDADAQVALGWPSSGIEQIGFALLTEAARREALLQMLMLESSQPAKLARLRAMSDEDRLAELDQMGKQLRIQMNKTLAAVATSVVQEAYLAATAASD